MKRFKRNYILDHSYSIESLGLKYLHLQNLSNKITQKFLYRFEFFLFSELRKLKSHNNFNISLFSGSKKNALKSNNSNFPFFDFYFTNTNKENYFSSIILNNSLGSKKDFISFFKDKSFNSRNKLLYENFSSNFLNKRLLGLQKLKNLKWKPRSFNILFSIEKNKNFAKFKPDNSSLKKFNRNSRIELRHFFGFLKYKHFYKFLLNFKSKNRIFSLSLLNAFETRLEFCLMKLNFVSSTYFSRQYIRSGKILINFKANFNCFYILKRGDLVSFNPSIFFYQYYIMKFLVKNKLIPFYHSNYFELDYRLLMACLIYYPKLNEVQTPYLKKLSSLNF